MLTQVTNVNLVIYFNCKEKLSAPPLKRYLIEFSFFRKLKILNFLFFSFYRYVLESEIRYANDKIVKPLAFFQNMPQSTVLTMNMHPPVNFCC